MDCVLGGGDLGQQCKQQPQQQHAVSQGLLVSNLRTCLMICLFFRRFFCVMLCAFRVIIPTWWWVVLSEVTHATVEISDLLVCGAV